MAGLKFADSANNIVVDAYQEFTQKLTGTFAASGDPYYNDIDEDNSRQRIQFLRDIASNHNAKLKMMGQGGNAVNANFRKTRLTVTFDDYKMVGRKNKRKINMSLPHNNPTQLTYLEDYVKKIVEQATGVSPNMNAQQKKNSTELLLGVMLLTRCF